MIPAILAVACVILVEKLPLSYFIASIDDVIPAILAVACVILVEKLPLSDFSASIDDVIPAILAVACVILVEKEELSCTNEPLISTAICAELDINVFDVEPASTSLNLVEILPLSSFKANILEVIAVNLSLTEPLSATKLVAVTLPLTLTESPKSIVSPPVTDSKASALTTPLAVIFPAITKCPNEPVELAEPLILSVISTPSARVLPTYWLIDI